MESTSLSLEFDSSVTLISSFNNNNNNEDNEDNQEGVSTLILPALDDLSYVVDDDNVSVIPNNNDNNNNNTNTDNDNILSDSRLLSITSKLSPSFTCYDVDELFEETLER